MTDTAPPTAPFHLLRRWGISGRIRWEIPGTGLMNETWIITHSGGRCVLRRHLRTEPDQVRFEHELLGRAAAAGIPCPTVLPTRAGRRLVVHEGRLHTLYTAAEGRQFRVPEIGEVQAVAMGRMLASIHTGLAEWSTGPRRDGIPELGTCLGRIDQLIRQARSGPPELAWTIDSLTERRRWVEGSSPQLPPNPPEPEQMTRGDYQPSNLFFRNGRVSSVIDWDQSRISWPSVEVVRTMHHSFLFHPVRSRLFLDAYRSVRHLSPDLLSAGAAWLGYQHDRSVWVMEQLIEAKNPRLISRAQARAFVPFDRQWEELGLT